MMRMREKDDREKVVDLVINSDPSDKCVGTRPGTLEDVGT